MTEDKVREPILPEPSGIAYAPDTLRGKIDSVLAGKQDTPVEDSSIRKPILPNPSGIAYAPDTLQGKIDAAGQKVNDVTGKYFRGENPMPIGETPKK